MKPWSIFEGDVEENIKAFADNSFDGCLTDPPYGYRFMGKKWDYEVPSTKVWEQVYRVLKPGAHALVFGGPRTFHRQAVNIEDAGFEIRDSIAWIYGSGFPKSLNVSKAIDKKLGCERPVIGSQVLSGNACVPLSDKGGTYGIAVGTVPAKSIPITGPGSPEATLWDGYGTALKPAIEPVLLVRKPLIGTVADNALAHGTGGIAIDGTRIGHEPIDSGRWPANVILDETTAALLDEQSGRRPSTLTGRGKTGSKHANPGDNNGTSWFGGGNSSVYADDGGASRFFYVSKAGRKERELGCEHLPLRSAGEMVEREEDSAGINNPRAGAGRTGGARNHHPTVKPITLTEYLARLILPPHLHTRLLVPYSGSGSEMIGGIKAGWGEVWGIEQSAEYREISESRLAYWSSK